MNDRAGLLSPSARAALEARLADFERETSHQVAVLTVPSLEGEPIESFSLRVVEAWKVGQAGLDNGALLLVAAQDRRARIEVGYGLEGAVPDAIAKRILEDAMFPHLRAGNPEAGVVAGVEALLGAARGEEIPAERRPRGRRERPDGGPVEQLLFAGVLASFFGRALGRRRRWLGAALAGVLGGALGYFLVGTLLALGVGFALAFVLGLVLPGGLHGGGLGGPGRWRGRGRGGGGFSGGGGGFGGGGASGSW